MLTNVKKSPGISLPFPPVTNLGTALAALALAPG